MSDTPERRKVERRQAFLNMSWDEGLAYIKRMEYTGEFSVIMCHAHQGEPKRVLVPNPAGWAVKPS